ncbi:UvrD-helicase domain-containing protein [Anaeromyxobacter sp. SG17]|uniref:UvrD-helicase domain-containing protein n=1 Tax=Anaeromyxobacter sp. SG17 TaxID=2925405 RepID=UPI001F592FC5|nr:UvrD-helicase domain-containing protein [Anaeromyxobacter sp. SG17]
MKYLAITERTADWLLSQPEHRRALAEALPQLSDTAGLSKTVLAIGSLRVCATADARVLALWNADYVSNVGEEPWGILRLESPYGLLDVSFVEEVFERELYVCSQRLKGLVLVSTVIHHAHEGGVHTCVSGRGPDAIRNRIAFVEADVMTGSTRQRAVLCIGPTFEMPAFREAALKETPALHVVAKAANGLLAEAMLRPQAETTLFANLRDRFTPVSALRADAEGPVGEIPALERVGETSGPSSIDELTYEQWTAPDSRLTAAQRRILESGHMDRQPIRLVGAAGSGKTLLMMLLAMRRLTAAETAAAPARVLYVVHNSAMKNTVWLRFLALGGERFLEGSERRLDVKTLFDYSRETLGIEETPVIDADAYETKLFQVEQVKESLRAVLANEKHAASIRESKVFSSASQNEAIFPLVGGLIADEIATAIKGHGLVRDRKRYVESERRLSRLHGALSPAERDIVFDVFEHYHREVFEKLEVFDADDLAMSLLLRLRSPIWEMRRKKLGYDHVFVDETQLFDENERKIFPLLTTGTTPHVPVALAMDEAQQTRATSSAGLGLLGFDRLADEALETVHRSTKAILELAFFVVQRTTDLFGAEFPDFTAKTVTVIPDEHPLAEKPVVVTPASSAEFGKFVLRQIRALRKKNVRQIGVVCHAEARWGSTEAILMASDLPVRVLTRRGERLDAQRPAVVLARPEAVGGQEFDAVIAIGLEQGVVPPRVEGNDALSMVLEQQALREMYVSFTRARYRLVIANGQGSAPNPVLAMAVERGLLAAERVADSA